MTDETIKKDKIRLRAAARIPSFYMIAATVLVVAILGLMGEGRIYPDLTPREHLSRPFVSQVLTGIHEGRFPWSKEGTSGRVTQEAAEAEQAIETILTSALQEDAEAPATEEVLPEGSGGEGPEMPQSGTDAAQPETEVAPAEETEVAPAEETEAQAAAPAESTDEEDLLYPDLPEVDESGITAQAKRENETYVRAESMPDGVCSAVVQAVDYGTANPRYLTSPGITYGKDASGPFAENGEYYRLRSVDDYYFADALFIGDSRTDGLYDYGGMKGKAGFIARESLSVYNLWTEKLPYHAADGTEEELLLLQLLQRYSFGKIYLSVGVNELGIPRTQDYYQKYKEALAVIRQLQPGALIYIDGIMHVTATKSKTSDIYNNTAIVERNQAIATLANGHDIFYIDVNSAICDENGDIPDADSFDGVHLFAPGYTKWHTFLLRNAIVRSTDKDYTGSGPVPLPQEDNHG